MNMLTSGYENFGNTALQPVTHGKLDSISAKNDSNPASSRQDMGVRDTRSDASPVARSFRDHLDLFLLAHVLPQDLQIHSTTDYISRKRVPVLLPSLPLMRSKRSIERARHRHRRLGSLQDRPNRDFMRGMTKQGRLFRIYRKGSRPDERGRIRLRKV